MHKSHTCYFLDIFLIYDKDPSYFIYICFHPVTKKYGESFSSFSSFLSNIIPEDLAEGSIQKLEKREKYAMNRIKTQYTLSYILSFSQRAGSANVIDQTICAKSKRVHRTPKTSVVHLIMKLFLIVCNFIHSFGLLVLTLL